MLKILLIILLLLQGSAAEPAKDAQRGQQQTLAQSSPTPTSGSADHDERTGSAWVISLVTVIALVIYTVFAGMQWLAIRKQATSAREQVGKMQGQLDEMKRQAGLMERGLAETEKLTTHNENMVKTVQGQLDAVKNQNEVIKESISIGEQSAIYAQRAYVTAGIQEIEEGFRFHLRVENSGNTPANDVCVSYAYGLRDKPPVEKGENGLLVYDAGYTQSDRLGLIAPANNQIVVTPKSAQMTGPEFQRWKLSQIRFYCWGIIVYEDIFNRKRRTEFCFHQSQRHPNGYPCEHGNHAM